MVMRHFLNVREESHDEEKARKLPDVQHTAVLLLRQSLEHRIAAKRGPFRVPGPTKVQAAAYEALSLASLVHR